MATVKPKPKSKVANAKVAKIVPRKALSDYSLIELCLVTITVCQVVHVVLGCLA